MNSTLITMEPELARAKLKAYRADKHKDAEELYGQCAAAYQALANGTPLIELTPAIREGGVDEQGRPRLAVARADRSEVRLSWAKGHRFAHFSTNFGRSASYRHGESYVRAVDMGVVPPKWMEWFARVPMVPADVRPKTGQLKDWFILWEVTEWTDRPQTARAPIDPYLLKHLGGDLYAVLAEWELTDLERAILNNQLTGRR